MRAARTVCFIAVVAIVVFVSACQRRAAVTNLDFAQQTSTQPGEEGAVRASKLMGGAQLWSENCVRCHNLRWPRERSDREWNLIVHHMRVRANLTAEEHRLILQFLQSAN